MRAARVEINLDALRHNLKCIRSFAPNKSILAMVKANAYGHGLETVATALHDADAFGVACLEEAIRLRGAGIKQRIVLMEGFFTSDELALICELDLDIVIHQFSQVEVLEQLTVPKAVTVWLKVDTGMNRLGFIPSELGLAWQRLKQCPNVAVIECILSHLAEADNIDSKVTSLQLRQFFEAASNLPCKRSLANSAGILAWPETHSDWIRPGVTLYGISPFPGKIGMDHGLKPAMTVISEIIAIRQLRKGDKVGYGGLWVCPEDMSIGVVAIGYGDGYPRHIGNGARVLVNGKLVPLVGQVSMDMLTIDLRSYPTAQVGERVVLWGEGLPIEEVARNVPTIAYELLCGVAQRLKIVQKEVQLATSGVTNK